MPFVSLSESRLRSVFLRRELPDPELRMMSLVVGVEFNDPPITVPQISADGTKIRLRASYFVYRSLVEVRVTFSRTCHVRRTTVIR